MLARNDRQHLTPGSTVRVHSTSLIIGIASAISTSRFAIAASASARGTSLIRSEADSRSGSTTLIFHGEASIMHHYVPKFTGASAGAGPRSREGQGRAFTRMASQWWLDARSIARGRASREGHGH